MTYNALNESTLALANPADTAGNEGIGNPRDEADGGNPLLYGYNDYLCVDWEDNHAEDGSVDSMDWRKTWSVNFADEDLMTV